LKLKRLQNSDNERLEKKSGKTPTVKGRIDEKQKIEWTGSLSKEKG